MRTMRGLHRPLHVTGRVERLVLRAAQVDPLALRRNVVVPGINLFALKNTKLQLGEATIEPVGPCQPCSRMEEAFGAGGYAAMRGHRGMTARILAGG